MSVNATTGGLKSAQRVVAALDTERKSLELFKERYPRPNDAPPKYRQEVPG